MSIDILSNMHNQELSQLSSPPKINNTKTFAETTANTTFPKKDQAIILNTINEIPQIEYVKAFSKITLPKNIIFASRISNNRFCIYFRDKITVDELTQNYSYITVNENQIPFRRLVNPAKRFIISNAHPIIPHEVITEHLLLENIKTLSPITFLKAGFQDELAHISSFRRQVYIHPDDTANVPGSIIIKYDNTDFRIFLTDDTLICYACKQSGHTSNHCKKEPNTMTNNKYTTQKPTIDDAHTTSSYPTHEEDITEVNTIAIPKNSQNSNILSLTMTNTTLPNKQIKRSLPTSSCPTSPTISEKSNTQPNIEKPKQTKNLEYKLLESKKNKKTPQDQIKKLKKSNSLENIATNDEDHLKSAHDLFFENEEINISFYQFKYIIENFSNKSINIHSLCEEAKVDIPSMLKTIEIVRPKINDRATKTKLTKLANLLFQATPQELYS
ncbi:unnamed protein product [Macrosiphum euphorbiae]|uniref:CCHC-type domain-containing protein n=2 Tax=Macrosiphum euphorbiae TaxID=13131 RepID=A0AAV0VN08_9HEMI|nr:unnamed protein product [Macrosiphum euphorbiae]